MLTKLQHIKCILANYTSKISDISWQKDIPDNSSLGLQLFIPFRKDFCRRWAGVVLELAPEPTPPKLPGFPGTFQTPNSFTEKATNLLFCKGKLELIRLLIIKLDLHSLLLLAVWAFSWQPLLSFYFLKQHRQSSPAAEWTHAFVLSHASCWKAQLRSEVREHKGREESAAKKFCFKF